MSLTNDFTGYDPIKNPEDESFLSKNAFMLAGDVSDMNPNYFPDPEKWGMSIENQGQIGSCQGNSITTAIEVCNYNKRNKSLKQLSRMHAYIETQKIDGIQGDNGSTITGGVKFAKEKGAILESLYPYPNSYPGWAAHNRKIQDPSIVNAERSKIDTHVNIHSWEQGLLWIYQGGTLSLGTFWPIDLDGNAVCRKYSYSKGMHATCSCGIVKMGNEILIKTANSHSTRSGKNGYYFWTQYAFEKMLNTKYCLAIGVGLEGEMRMDYYDSLTKGMV